MDNAEPNGVNIKYDNVILLKGESALYTETVSGHSYTANSGRGRNKENPPPNREKIFLKFY